MCQLIKTCRHRSRASVYANIEHKKGGNVISVTLIKAGGATWAGLSYFRNSWSGIFPHNSLGRSDWFEVTEGLLIYHSLLWWAEKTKNFETCTEWATISEKPIFFYSCRPRTGNCSCTLIRTGQTFSEPVPSIASDSCSWLTGLFPIF